jgi:hypothetical protein
MNIADLMIDGIPLVAVIFGLVEFAKSFGLKGPWLTAFSMLLGLAFGIGYKIAASGIPVGFAMWFATAVFGLALGLVACGFYDFIDKRTNNVGP